MLSKLRPRLTYANVVATLALFIAAGGGTAYAAHLVVRGSDVVNESLTGADVKGKNGTSTTKAVNGTIKGADISGQPANPALGQPAVNGSLTHYDMADNSLRSADIRNDSLTGTDIKDISITGDDINETLTGSDIQEHTLAPVPNADKAGVRNAEIVSGNSTSDSYFFKSAVARCPQGKIPVGGGSSIWGARQGVSVKYSAPVLDPFGTNFVWMVTAQEDTPQDGDWEIRAHAMCVDG